MRENYSNDPAAKSAQNMAAQNMADTRGDAVNSIRTGPDIGRVTGPLVQLLAMDGLSWSDREQITDAIRNLIRIHKDVESERRHLSMACAQAEAGAGGVVIHDNKPGGGWGPAPASTGFGFYGLG